MSVYIGCHISINCQSAVSLDISAQRIGRPAYFQIHISINCHFRPDSCIAVCHMDAFGTGCACHFYIQVLRGDFCFLRSRLVDSVDCTAAFHRLHFQRLAISPDNNILFHIHCRSACSNSNFRILCEFICTVFFTYTGIDILHVLRLYAGDSIGKCCFCLFFRNIRSRCIEVLPLTIGFLERHILYAFGQAGSRQSFGDFHFARKIGFPIFIRSVKQLIRQRIQCLTGQILICCFGRIHIKTLAVGNQSNSRSSLRFSHGKSPAEDIRGFFILMPVVYVCKPLIIVYADINTFAVFILSGFLENMTRLIGAFPADQPFQMAFRKILSVISIRRFAPGFIRPGGTILQPQINFPKKCFLYDFIAAIKCAADFISFILERIICNPRPAGIGRSQPQIRAAISLRLIHIDRAGRCAYIPFYRNFGAPGSDRHLIFIPFHIHRGSGALCQKRIISFGIIFIDFYISAAEINVRMPAIGKCTIGIHFQIHQSVNGQLRPQLKFIIISGIDGRTAIVAEAAILFHINRPGILFIMGIHRHVPIDGNFRIAAQIHAQPISVTMSPDIRISINRQPVRRILIRSVLPAYADSFSTTLCIPCVNNQLFSSNSNTFFRVCFHRMNKGMFVIYMSIKL